MSSFVWNGNTYPLPDGWTGLSIEEWFHQFERVRDRMMNVDDENIQPMTDEDGDELDPEECLLIQVFGFQSGGHWEAFRNWGVSQWARQTGEHPTNLEARLGGMARERIMAEKAGAMTGRGGGGGGLDPVEGVDLNTWAAIQAALASGGDIDQMLSRAGMDRPRWDRVSAEWMNRMTTDTSGAIATAYGNAFAGASQGQFGGHAAQAAAQGVGGNVGAEPIPFELWVEIQEAQSAAASRGQDPGAVLRHFGMSPVDWSNVSMYWSKRMQQEATRYHQLFSQYSDHYRAKYSG
jgi:hypothetical protein